MEYDEVKKMFSICGDCIVDEVLNTISIGKSKEVDYLKIVINDIFEYTLIDNDWIIFEELPTEDLSTPILTTVRKDIKIRLEDINKIQVFVR